MDQQQATVAAIGAAKNNILIFLRNSEAGGYFSAICSTYQTIKKCTNRCKGIDLRQLEIK